MITEVKERQVKVSRGILYYYATIRDGKVTEISKFRSELEINREAIQSYIDFLKEVLQAIEETKKKG